MIQVVKLGPIEEGADTTSIYACVADGAVLRQMGAATETDSAALEEIRQKLGPERWGVVRCEPRMAAAGAQLGVEAAPLSKEHRELVAAMACQITSRNMDVEVGQGPVIDLLRAAADAYQVLARAPFSFEMLAPFQSGPSGRSGQTSLFSVHVTQEPDTVAVVGDSLAKPPGGPTGQSNMLAVLFKREPAYLVERVEAAFGLSRAVVPFRALGSDLAPIDAEDLRLLTHILGVLGRAGEQRPGMVH